MFLLGWPARTISMICRCRGRELPDALPGVLPPCRQFGRVLRLLQSAFYTGKQFVAANRFFDEVRCTGLHRLNRHRHVALPGDHDGRQPVAMGL